MPYYNDLRPIEDFEKRDYLQIFPSLDSPTKIRAIDGIIRLKSALASHLPPRKNDRNILVASWNIKEFGHTKQRLPEAYFYIAEIVSHFDLIVIQEVKSSVKDLSILMRLLGSDWEYLVSDITDGTDGNSERSAYVFNSKRVKLSGLAGELVLWKDLTKGSKIKQLKRTPYLTGFKAGWKNFAMLSLHLHPGDDKQDISLRKEEVRLLTQALSKKIKETWPERLIISGDMNLYHKEDDATVQLFTDAGYQEIEGLAGKNTNASDTQIFDRFFINSGDYFRIAKNDLGHENGNVFNLFEHVYREGEEVIYKKEIVEAYGGKKDLENDSEALRRQYQSYWKRNQMSDHLPIWFELSVDDSSKFLTSRRNKLVHAT